jgi:hypothetical protein
MDWHIVLKLRGRSKNQNTLTWVLLRGSDYKTMDGNLKIVIHTEQEDGIDAFYIANGVEVSSSLESY